MERRKFIQTAGYSAAADCIPPHLTGIKSGKTEAGHQVRSADKQVSVVVKENTVFIETHTLSATIQKGIITSLISRISGEEFIEKPDVSNFRALQLLYIRNEVIQVNEEKFGRTESLQISDKRAEIRFHSWDGEWCPCNIG